MRRRLIGQLGLLVGGGGRIAGAGAVGRAGHAPAASGRAWRLVAARRRHGTYRRRRRVVVIRQRHQPGFRSFQLLLLLLLGQMILLFSVSASGSGRRALLLLLLLLLAVVVPLEAGSAPPKTARAMDEWACRLVFCSARPSGCLCVAS